jgi:hypothetical protein
VQESRNNRQYKRGNNGLRKGDTHADQIDAHLAKQMAVTAAIVAGMYVPIGYREI